MRNLLIIQGLLFCSVASMAADKENYSKKYRMHMTKVVRAICEKSMTNDACIDQARKKAKLDDASFVWHRDADAKRVYVDMWLAYDMLNSETKNKERIVECFQDCCFADSDVKKLKLRTFYKKMSKVRF